MMFKNPFARRPFEPPIVPPTSAATDAVGPDPDAFVSWDAYPAAGRITITGRRATGPTVKLTGVKTITPSGTRGYVVAIDKEGARHRLAV